MLCSNKYILDMKLLRFGSNADNIITISKSEKSNISANLGGTYFNNPIESIHK